VNKILRDLLFALIAVYFAQGWLYTEGSFISRSCVVGLIILSFFYLIKTSLISGKNSPFYNAWTIFLILNIVGFLFTSDLNKSTTYNMFKNILIFMLPFYPLYYFSYKGDLKSIHLTRFFLILIPIVIMLFYTNRSNILLERTTANPNIVNNIAYSFVSLLPFVFLIKNRIISMSFMILIIFFIISGVKRGAIIAGSIGLVFYFYYLIKKIENRNKIIGFLSVIIIISSVTAFAYKTSLSNEFMINRMVSILEGNTSGRLGIYDSIFNEWYNSDNILNLVFGFGFAASVDITDGNYAHNDWLELLSNYGILGICIYAFLFYTALKLCFKKEWHFDKRILMVTITLIWFFTSLISMRYTSLSGIFQSILLGYLVGNESKELE